MIALLVLFVVTLVACQPTDELALSTADQGMSYVPAVLTTHAGHAVHLMMTNRSFNPRLAHNWVLTRPGADAVVAASGAHAGPTQDFFEPSQNVIAHTAFAQPGSTIELTFTAPAAGRYPFVCTYPGHYPMMRGTLVVEP